MSGKGTATAWSTQSLVTDPGKAVTAVDELPAEIRALREASSQLVFHYRAGGDFAENGVPADRAGEINTRYADDMFALPLERGEPTFGRTRMPPDRVVGCCRDATVLFLSLTRRKRIPARARVGFAAYFHPGWLVDHVIAEVWDEAEGRWRLVDPEMSSEWTPELNGRPVDWMDLADDQFVTGPRGWPYIAHNVIHDLAALNKTEMLLWEGWGMQLGHGDGPVPEADAALLDEVCARTADPGVSPDDVAALADRDEFRVPPTVTSFDPYGGPPREVTVRT
jgi:hypothetical protein